VTELLLIGIFFGTLWFSFQYGWWRATVPFRYPRILMYHMVANHKPRARFNKLRVEPNEFEKQIRWLSQNGWKFRFVSELPVSENEKSVVLTFDDGYRDNFLTADPVLAKYHAKATLFLTEGRHDVGWSSKKKAHHDDEELQLEAKLLDEDVRSMISSGRWEIGSHGLTHENLRTSDSKTRAAEIRESKSLLENKFGVSVESFAYPFGIYGREDVDLVEESGYRFGLTTEQGISMNLTEPDSYVLKRIKVSGAGGMYSFTLRIRTGKCRFRD